MIPKEILHKLELYFKDARFAKVYPNSKSPYEKAWTTENNYVYYDAELKAHLEQGGNYCFVCGFEGLCIVDFDHPDLDAKFVDHPLFKDTFRVRSATKGLTHAYFYLEDPENGKNAGIFDKDNNTLCDIQYTSKAIVGFGSKIDGRSYNIDNDVAPKRIYFGELMEALKDEGHKNTLVGELVPDSQSKEFKDDPVLARIREKIKIKDLLKDAGIVLKPGSTNSECPFHKSKGGQCLSRTSELFNCFHCGKRGDIFSLYQDVYDVTFPEAVRALKLKSGIIDTSSSDSSLSTKEQEYYKLPLERFIIHASHEETQYELQFSDCVIWLLPGDLLRSARFRVKYFNEKQIMLPALSEGKWTKLVNFWASEYKFVNDVTSFNTSNTQKEILFDALRTCTVVEDSTTALNLGKLLYRKETPDLLYISNIALRNLLETKRMNMTLNEARKVMSEVVEDSKVIACDSGAQRFITLRTRGIPDFDTTKIKEINNAY